MGIILKKKVGDRVTRGEPLALLYSDGDPVKIRRAEEKIIRAYGTGRGPVARPRLLIARVTPEGVETIDDDTSP
jgi:pyrimidine-nucleoside phosphorylase